MTEGRVPPRPVRWGNDHPSDAQHVHGPGCSWSSDAGEVECLDGFTYAKPGRVRSRTRCHDDVKAADLVNVDCAWGYCTNLCCASCGQIVMGFGSIACPCDNTNGWRSKYPEGQAKPNPPLKAVGRHGGKIARGQRRRREREAWIAEWMTTPARVQSASEGSGDMGR